MNRADAIINNKFKKFLIKERKGKIFLYKDTRTKVIDGVPHIKPIGVDQNQIYIVCPYCGEFHQHGTADGEYAGSLVPHCVDSRNRENYYLEKL